MSRINPLIVETLAGLGGVGKTQLAYLNYLLLQALVLVIWWPKNTVMERLEIETRPDTLLAVLVAIGISVAYLHIRAGAEELLLPGQHSLREWVIATPLKLGRILRGYLAALVLQTLQMLLLSAPLLIMAYVVAGDGYAGPACSLLMILPVAIFYRLVGAVLYLSIGHHDALIFITLRLVLVAGYVLIGILLPVTSHLMVSTQLLNSNFNMRLDNEGFLSLLSFLSIYSVLCIVLIAVLYRLLRRT